MHFYCLNTIKTAIKRVEIRTKNEGHPIEDWVIKHKWKEGYKNLNLYFKEFDLIYLIDNSKNGKPPKIYLEIEKINMNEFILKQYEQELQKYVGRRFPSIFSLLENE